MRSIKTAGFLALPSALTSAGPEAVTTRTKDYRTRSLQGQTAPVLDFRSTPDTPGSAATRPHGVTPKERMKFA